MSATQTQRLAEFILNTRTEDIPANVMDAARDALIDTVGCALVGSIDEVGEHALNYVRDMGARREATIWGTNVATTMAEAAFVNGVFGHALDFDDVHASVHGHPSTTMIPAVIAVAEAVGAPGKDVLAAYAIGLEVCGKLGIALGTGHYQRGWHATATTGVFGSTAVAARLLKLNVTQLKYALALAASQASGLIRNFGTMTKPFHAGHAARCAVQSALLARAGFTADADIFDGAKNLSTPTQTRTANRWSLCSPTSARPGRRSRRASASSAGRAATATTVPSAPCCPFCNNTTSRPRTWRR
jgi:2-methylcitrate dehydratase PrpD